MKQSLKKIDRLFFLIGMDAFADIAKWREPEALFRECEFIVASRPGTRWRMWPMRCQKVCVQPVR